MRIDPARLEATVREVLARLNAASAVTEGGGGTGQATGDGVFADMDSAIEAAWAAQREYL